MGRRIESASVLTTDINRGASQAELPAASSPNLAVVIPAQDASQASSATRGANPNQSSTSLSAGPMGQQLEQIEAQWCSHAKQAHEQSEASIKQGNPLDMSAPTKIDGGRLNAAVAASVNLPTNQARYAVTARLQKSWIAQLRNQGDARSLATAAFLAIEGVGRDDGWAENVMAFHAEASRTSDPYVLQLWQFASRWCGTRGTSCQALPHTRWAQIEPNNLLAWLANVQGSKGLTEAQWRGVEAARYVRDYQYELRARLLALLAKTPPSLELEIGLETAERGLFSPSVLTLERECTKPEAANRHRNACLRAASLFWNAPQALLMDRATALALSERLNAQGDAVWAGRLVEFNAISHEVGTALLQAELEPKEWRKGCDKLPARRQRLLDIAEGGTWKAAQTLLAQGAAR
jgi:hypothetical protein